MKKYEIAIIVSHLYLGGFTSSLLNLLKCLENYSDINVALVMLDNTESEYDKEIPDSVKVIRLEQKKYSEKIIYKALYKFRFYQYCFWELLYKRVLKKELPNRHVIKLSQYSNKYKAKQLENDFNFLKDYDCVISWEEGFCNYVLADKIPAKHKVGYIHPNYTETSFCKKADRECLNKLDRIVTISESCYETLKNVFPKYNNKILYLPNRLNYEYYRNLAAEHSVQLSEITLNLFTAVRIHNAHKAVFRMVSVMKRLVDENLKVKWYVAGDGQDVEEFKKRINDNGLEDHIICLGSLTNPCPYMAAADLYVQQSYYEGRPVSVDEAMLLGTPALITNYSSANEQVTDGFNGWIVDNNEDAIYLKLKELIKNPELIKEAKTNIDNTDKSKYEDCTAFIEMIKSLCEDN